MSSRDAASPMVKVWDPLVRVFHWSLVFFFIVAFITGDDWLDLHEQAGYAVSFLIGFRLLWGLVGTSLYDLCKIARGYADLPESYVVIESPALPGA